MAEGQHNGFSPQEDSGLENGLTPIHGRIHCGATQPVEAPSETDRLHLDHLFDVLADVALSVAKRRLTNSQETSECEQ